jgi:hypothetical protein
VKKKWRDGSTPFYGILLDLLQVYQVLTRVLPVLVLVVQLHKHKATSLIFVIQQKSKSILEYHILYSSRDIENVGSPNSR